MKSKKSMLIGCLCVLFLSVGTTAAYFTYWQRINNQMTVGESTIEIEEDYKPPKELETGENVFKKTVQVKNTGGVPCFVRVYADFSDSTVKELASLTADGNEWFPASEYEKHLPDGWKYIDETDDPLLGGYFYWMEPLEPHNSTDPLFEKVKITFENSDQITDFDIIVYGECVQTLDMEGEEFSGSDAWEQAWTEFLERR